MSLERNVICWRQLTVPFPSDMPDCNHSGWCEQGSTLEQHINEPYCPTADILVDRLFELLVLY